jgi:dihydroorotate dehydrogenase (fumarate)
MHPVLHGGIDTVATLVNGLRRWMDEREFTTLDEMRGLLSWERSKDRTVYTRANYLRILERYSTP